MISPCWPWGTSLSWSSTIFSSTPGMGRPMEPTFFGPSGGLQQPLAPVSVNPHPSMISKPNFSLKPCQVSEARAAEPDIHHFMELRSYLAGSGCNSM